MVLKLYHCPGTRSARSLWLMRELGLNFELVEMPFDLKILRTPEYLAVHPLGRVPCLVDGGVTVFESGAITQYLCENYDRNNLHRAPGHPERPEWLQWLHFAETLVSHLSNLAQQFLVLAPADRSEVVQKLESRRAEKALGVLDAQVKDRDYLLKSGFSAVDINVGYGVHGGLMNVPSIDANAFPHLKKYYERISSRPHFQSSFPAPQKKSA